MSNAARPAAAHILRGGGHTPLPPPTDRTTTTMNTTQEATKKLEADFKRMLECGAPTADGPCPRRSEMAGIGHCWFHTAMDRARDASPEDVDALARALGDLTPRTDAEKRKRLVKSRLWSVEFYAKSVAREIASARKAGATKRQIDAAVRRGESA